LNQAHFAADGILARDSYKIDYSGNFLRDQNRDSDGRNELHFWPDGILVRHNFKIRPILFPDGFLARPKD
jgi:hypothetical protein